MTNPVSIFILQLAVIIAMSAVFGYIFRKIGQPAVMGEITAGIILGPSVFGALSPAASSFVFPPGSFGNLQFASQVGLVLFMFVIGMELDFSIMKQKVRSALFISNMSIGLSFLLGMGLAWFLYADYAPAGIPLYAFALFMGIAMSITAFPVLARIIKERNLMNTRIGTIAITSAAIGDITGWCILAFVIAIVRMHSINAPLYTLLAALLYILIMLFVIRPLLKKLLAFETQSIWVKRAALPVILVLLFLSAWYSQAIGIHALFGAFLAGIIMPVEGNFRKPFIDKMERLASIMLLPIFFVLTGLRTQLGLLNGPTLWGLCGIITLIAIAGKFGGSALAARLSGEPAYESLSIGALMNTRGLMELIILNIGYDLGILKPAVFTMMVLMALATTFMTAPLLSLLNRIYKR